MTKTLSKRLLLVSSALAVPMAAACWNAQANPAKKSAASGKAATASKTRLAALPAGTAAKPKSTAPLPKYVPMNEIKRLWADRDLAVERQRFPVFQPTWEGHALKRPMRDLLTDPTWDVGAVLPKAPQPKVERPRFAQAFPRPVPPAAVPSGRRRAPARNTTPKWVRYPLEFQLCGIGLGTKAVDKDRVNRIDRYGLFALHGNPTAVVVPSLLGTGITVGQQPPEVAALFPSNQGGGLPDWASAITVTLDNNHVEWLYRRETYSMGFVVDRLGYVDAVVVAGVQSPIAKTQLEDPLHTVQLGDDLRKVLFRYGYPDTIETYNINAVGASAPVVAAPAQGAAPGGAEGAAAPPPAPAPDAGAAGAEAGAGGGAQAGNAAFRTFELRYEQSYNAVFTIRNNRVVRIYIFGDPDFFNARRRQQLRSTY